MSTPIVIKHWCRRGATASLAVDGEGHGVQSESAALDAGNYAYRLLAN